jgi:hypothetical protein
MGAGLARAFVALTVIAAMLACGRVDYDPTTSARDAGDGALAGDAGDGALSGDAGDGALSGDAGDGALSGDAGDGAVAGPCDWRAGPRFSSPELLDALSLPAAREVDPTLSPDGLTLYFASDRAGKLDLYESTRPTLDGSFGPPSLTTLIDRSSTADDYRVGLTADSLTAYVASARPGGTGSIDVWLSVRPSPSDPFPALAPAIGVNTIEADYDPDMSGSGDELWLAPVLSGTTQAIFVARRIAGALSFEAPTLVTELRSGTVEADPALTHGGLTIVFSSNRAGDLGLWYATRDSLAAPFGTPAPLTEINDAPGSDGDPYVSPDGCEMVFSSGRVTGTDLRDLYRVRFLR